MIERVLGFDQFSRTEMEQPMVFFRVGWDFRWLSRRSLLARIAGQPVPSGGIGEVQAPDESPVELDEFIEALRLLARVENGDPIDPVVAARARTGGEVAQRLLKEEEFEKWLVADSTRRQVLVLPGGWHRLDTWVALKAAIAIGAAMVLPPEEGAWAWTVVWSKPSLVVAGPDQLVALVKEVSGVRPWRRKRALKKVRWVVALTRCEGSGKADGPCWSEDAEAMTSSAHQSLEWLCRLGPSGLDLC